MLTGVAVAAGATSLYLTLRGETEHERRSAPVTRVALSPTGVRLEQSF